MRQSVALLTFLTGCVLLNPLAAAREVNCEQVPKTALAAAEADLAPLAYATHNIGNWSLNVANDGVWGESYELWADFFTGLVTESGSEYPKHSSIFSLNLASVWIGGIIGPDTLVTTGWDVAEYGWSHELTPEEVLSAPMVTRSISHPEWPGYEEAVSEQDFIAVLTDTIVTEDYQLDYLRQTPHEPLHVQVTQRSYAWSQDLTDDFVLFDLSIENIGTETIRAAYVGLLARPSMSLDYSLG